MHPNLRQNESDRTKNIGDVVGINIVSRFRGGNMQTEIERLAHLTEISAARMKEIAGGSGAEVTVSELARIASALGCQVSDLINENAQPDELHINELTRELKNIRRLLDEARDGVAQHPKVKRKIEAAIRAFTQLLGKMNPPKKRGSKSTKPTLSRDERATFEDALRAAGPDLLGDATQPKETTKNIAAVTAEFNRNMEAIKAQIKNLDSDADKFGPTAKPRDDLAA